MAKSMAYIAASTPSWTNTHSLNPASQKLRSDYLLLFKAFGGLVVADFGAEDVQGKRGDAQMGTQAVGD